MSLKIITFIISILFVVYSAKQNQLCYYGKSKPRGEAGKLVSYKAALSDVLPTSRFEQMKPALTTQFSILFLLITIHGEWITLSSYCVLSLSASLLFPFPQRLYAVT